MTIKPFSKQILISPIVEKAILGEVSCRYGRVEAIGDEVTKVKVGDTIGFESYGLKELTVEKEDFVFISENSDFLLCKICGDKQVFKLFKGNPDNQTYISYHLHNALSKFHRLFTI